ncbi:MAG TPA: hypothetical protein VGM47_06705 [Gammaproteobacteria bacterium]|jgi:hypothetical protein
MRTKFGITSVLSLTAVLYGCASPAILSTERPTDGKFAEITTAKADQKSGMPGVILLRIVSKDETQELKFDVNGYRVSHIYLSPGKYTINAVCMPVGAQNVQLQAEEAPLTIKVPATYLLDCHNTTDGPDFRLIPVTVWGQ